MSAAVVVLGGVTASGKSALALALAGEFGARIINADSMQVYRELPVLTAQPRADGTRRAPHRLYGVLPAAERCSAARWRVMAVAEIAAAHEAGELPLLVGGTGLYLMALMQGLSEIPEIPDDVRAAARARHRRLGGADFHADLALRDPVMAARLSPGDSQRLVRAWEVLEATGRSLADWQEGPREGPPPGLEFATVVLDPPRRAVYAACDARFGEMMARGALDEVAALLDLGLDPDLPAMRALGVRQLAAHLRGEMGLDEAVEKAQTATRRYAKRQSTWFRHQNPDARFENAQYSESLLPEIFSFIRQFLLTARR